MMIMKASVDILKQRCPFFLAFRARAVATHETWSTKGLEKVFASAGISLLFLLIIDDNCHQDLKTNVKLLKIGFYHSLKTSEMRKWVSHHNVEL